MEAFHHQSYQSQTIFDHYKSKFERKSSFSNKKLVCEDLDSLWLPTDQTPFFNEQVLLLETITGSLNNHFLFLIQRS